MAVAKSLRGSLSNFQAERARMGQILKILEREYSEAKCSLHYETPFQLLVATILSAQCTDERVNKVTPILFKKYPDAQAMSKATQTQIEKMIQSTGFFRSKAKSILETSKALVEKHDGVVPRNLNDLIALRGVGRKTANVVLGNAYGIPGLVVDTHVGRLSRRMGFTKETDPEKVEAEMMKLVPQEKWTVFSHYLIDHGRTQCTARPLPRCEECVVARFCPKIGVKS